MAVVVTKVHKEMDGKGLHFQKVNVSYPELFHRHEKLSNDIRVHIKKLYILQGMMFILKAQIGETPTKGLE